MMEKKLPEGWEWERLGDVAELIMGQSPPGDTYNEIDQGMPFLQGKSEFGDVSPEHVKYTTKPLKIAPNESVLMSVRAPVGDVNIANIDYCIGRGLASLSLYKGENAFLFYVLNYFKNKIEKEGTGSTFKAITKSKLQKFKIPLPPIETQRKIVAILAKAEETKKLRMQADELTSQLLQSVFFDMFGDPVKNPMGWKTIKLGEIGAINSGLTLNGQRRANKNNLFPYLRVANVFRNKLNLEEIKYIHISDSEFERFMLKKNDVLIVEGHGNIEEIGRAAIWKGEIPNCAHQNHLIRVRLDGKYIHSHFLSFFINSYGNHGYFSSKSRTTSGLNTISANKVRDAKIPLPPFALQQKFAQIVDKVEEIRKEMKKSKQETDNLFNALTCKAFTGELIT